MLKLQRRTLAALVSAIAFGVAACGGDEEKAQEVEQQTSDATAIPSQPVREPIVEPNEKGEIRYTGETESGDTFKAQIGGTVELPSEFGSDLPAYPGAVPLSAMETSGGTAIAALESDASVEEIVGFYRDQLNGNGWSIVSENDLGHATLLTATKDGRRVMVNAEGMDRGSRFTLTVGLGPTL